jgi:uncharacterized integral membrane protein (TIGR00697 family)
LKSTALAYPSVLYFPFTYLIADILTEVYGYARARSILWLSLLCSMIAAAVVQAALMVPAAAFFKDDAAFHLVFSTAPKIAVAGFLAMFSGDICNNYVLAKMKVWTKGKQLWLRFIASTVAGEGVNTVLFYGIAFYGVLPNNSLGWSILMGWAAKALVEIVMLPLTYPVVRLLKQVERVDFFDYTTDFNPFVTDAGE